MIILFQILFSLFAVFVILNVIKKGKDTFLGPRAVVFWSLFWLLATVAVWWPNSSTALANFLGIGRGADLLLYVSLAVIFFLLFRLNVKIEGLARGVTKIVREKAIEEVKK